MWYIYEFGAVSVSWGNALTDLGAPSIPFLLDYADDELKKKHVAVDLKRIVNRHPNLDPDIVTYILEPLFEKHKRWIQKTKEIGLL